MKRRFYKNRKVITQIGIMIALTMTVCTYNGMKNDVYADTTSISESVNKDENFKYVSDLTYENSRSGWGPIRINESIGQSKISLKIGNTNVLFSKGISIHAPGFVEYNVSEFVSEGYNRLTGYAGIDFNAGNGDGAGLEIYVYKNGEYERVFSTERMTKSTIAKKFDINLDGVSKIKFVTLSMGNNGSDHTEFANVKLYKSGNSSTEKEDPVTQGPTSVHFKSVDEYYNSIKSEISNINSFDIDTASEGLKKDILEAELARRIGYNLNAFASIDSDIARGLNVLENNQSLLELFLTGGKPDGSYSEALKVLGKLYDKYGSDINDPQNGKLYEKMMAALSLTHSTTVKLWTNSTQPSDPLVRYKIYKDMYNDGKLANNEQFKNLNVDLMRWVLGANIDDEEILWLNDYARKTSRKKNKRYDYELNPYEYIRYTFGYNYNKQEYYDVEKKEEWNEKYGIDSLTYGPVGNNKLWMVFNEGAVCGGISKTGTNLRQVFGEPASVIGQPGHAAYLIYSERDGKGVWTIGNNISGFTGSEKGERMPLDWPEHWTNRPYIQDKYMVSYILIIQSALDDKENLLKAQYYNMLGELYYSNNDIKNAEDAFKKGLDTQKINIDSLMGLIKTYAKDSDIKDEQYKELADFVLENYKNYPMPMVDMLNQITQKFKDNILKTEYDLKRYKSLKEEEVLNSSEYIQSDVAREMAKYLLKNKESEPLATFSFDGEDANTIVINPKYSSYKIRVRYSLDGGKTFKESDDMNIKLSDDEVKSINTTDGIIVGLVGTSETYKINIINGNKATDRIFVNDKENRVYGDVDGLLYRIDGEDTWHKYDPSENGTNFGPNHVIVAFKYAARKNMLEGDIGYRAFHKDDEKNKDYVHLNHLTLVSVSSDEKNTKKNLLDGIYGDLWHSKYSGDDEREVVIKMDTPRFIKEVELYVRTDRSSNGRPKKVSIYVSQDGENWGEPVKTIDNLANDAKEKVIPIDNPKLGSYIKIKADETYGDGGNKYFSLREIDLYENREKLMEELSKNVSLTYSTNSLTNQDVKVDLNLPEGYSAIDGEKYTFTENGIHEFRYRDKFGLEHTIEAKVDWIDKVLPTAEIVYDKTDETDGEVCASLINFNKEGIRVVNLPVSENGDQINCYEFKENGEFDFELVDKAGNKNTIKAVVTWIRSDKDEYVEKNVVKDDINKYESIKSSELYKRSDKEHQLKFDEELDKLKNLDSEAKIKKSDYDAIVTQLESAKNLLNGKEKAKEELENLLVTCTNMINDPRFSKVKEGDKYTFACSCARNVCGNKEVTVEALEDNISKLKIVKSDLESEFVRINNESTLENNNEANNNEANNNEANNNEANNNEANNNEANNNETNNNEANNNEANNNEANNTDSSKPTTDEENASNEKNNEIKNEEDTQPEKTPEASESTQPSNTTSGTGNDDSSHTEGSQNEPTNSDNKPSEAGKDNTASEGTQGGDNESKPNKDFSETGTNDTLPEENRDKESGNHVSSQPRIDNLSVGTNSPEYLLKSDIDKTAAILDDVISKDREIYRISGSNRYDTSIEISKRYFKHADHVVIASGNNEADALSSSLYSKMIKGPTLLSNVTSVDSSLLKELERLGCKKITIVGGENSISDKVVDQLKEKGYEVNRIAGKNRVETSKMIVENILNKTKSKAIIVANPDSMTDSLAVSYMSNKKNIPLLLSNNADEINNLIKKYGLKKIIIVGGVNIDNEKIDVEEVQTIKGKDRYDTSKQIYDNLNVGKNSSIVLANGKNSIDALSYGAVSYLQDAPILLVDRNNIPLSVKDTIKNSQGNIIILGGRNTIK